MNITQATTSQAPDLLQGPLAGSGVWGPRPSGIPLHQGGPAPFTHAQWAKPVMMGFIFKGLPLQRRCWLIIVGAVGRFNPPAFVGLQTPEERLTSAGMRSNGHFNLFAGRSEVTKLKSKFFISSTWSETVCSFKPWSFYLWTAVVYHCRIIFCMEMTALTHSWPHINSWPQVISKNLKSC